MEEAKNLRAEGKELSFGSFTRFPDLIMMDGGRGQVNIALGVLEQMGLSIPVCGMVRMIFTAPEACISTIKRCLLTGTARLPAYYADSG